MINKSTLFVLLASLTLTQNIFANGVEVFDDLEVYGIYEAYECIIDDIYFTGSGSSTDRHGGKLLITITNEGVEITSDVASVQSGNLTLVTKTEVEIIALNKTMLLNYRVMSNEFSYNTGNGKSRFRGGVGHAGGQVRAMGTCKEKLVF